MFDLLTKYYTDFMETSNTIWQQLKKQSISSGKPILALAPMADVTDTAFRQIIAEHSRMGQPESRLDVLWTEFVSADGLCHAQGKESLQRDLFFSETERPLIAQLFGSNPETMRQASRMVAEMGFDGIDINMGCPDKNIEKQGAGASMIKTPEIAGKIIQSTKDGIVDAGKNIPVSVKTRIGYYKPEIDTWIRFLLEQDIAVLTVHARTRKELSKVPARWETITECVKMRDTYAPQTLLFGNGDVVDIEDADAKAKQTGCDGVMIGRAIFGNPWLFDTTYAVESKRQSLPFEHILGHILPTSWLKKLKSDKHKYTRLHIPLQERFRVMIQHAELFEKTLVDPYINHPHIKGKSFSVMKKHFKAYAHGFSGAKELRMALMETNNSTDVKNVITEFEKHNRARKENF
jgi:nifR3 family TIM-barrel protein